MQNKRGQELSTSAIILIILGVIVLVVLIIGFVFGWQKIVPWVSIDNVNSIVTQCNSACFTRSDYDFCSRKRDLKVEGQVFKNMTCYYMAEKQNYGITKCEDVSCTNIVFVTLSANEAINTKCAGNEGKTIQGLNSKNELESYSCPSA